LLIGQAVGEPAPKLSLPAGTNRTR